MIGLFQIYYEFLRISDIRYRAILAPRTGSAYRQNFSAYRQIFAHIEQILPNMRHTQSAYYRSIIFVEI